MSVEPSPFSGYPFVIDPDAPRGQVFLMRPVDPLHGEEVAEPTVTFTEWSYDDYVWSDEYGWVTPEDDPAVPQEAILLDEIRLLRAEVAQLLELAVAQGEHGKKGLVIVTGAAADLDAWHTIAETAIDFVRELATPCEWTYGATHCSHGRLPCPHAQAREWLDSLQPKGAGE